MALLASLLLACLAMIDEGEQDIQQDIHQEIGWYAAAESCPSNEAVVRATSKHLGRELEAYPLDVVAQAWVQVAAAGYTMRLTIAVGGIQREHELTGSDCDRLARDAALLIATAVDPFASGPDPREPRTRALLDPNAVAIQRPRAREERLDARPVEPERTERPMPNLAPFGPVYIDEGVDEGVDEAVARVPARRGAIEGVLGVSGIGFVGLFPEVGGGVAVEAAIERGLFRWQLGASGWFGGSFRATQATIGGDLRGVAGTTGPCVVPSFTRVRVLVCAIVGAGAIDATPINTISQRRVARPWVFAGVDARVSWTPRPRLGIFVGVSVVPAIVRPSWSVSNPNAVHTMPPVAGVLSFGFELRGLRGRD